MRVMQVHAQLADIDAELRELNGSRRPIASWKC